MYISRTKLNTRLLKVISNNKKSITAQFGYPMKKIFPARSLFLMTAEENISFKFHHMSNRC